MDWDAHAIVSDDPHFHGRGNVSTGDAFHAAPNIDHSQDFVRNDISEWLQWLRHDIGFDGWRCGFPLPPLRHRPPHCRQDLHCAGMAKLRFPEH